MPVTLPNFRNASTNFLTANLSLSKKPVYYVRFGLVTGPVGTSSQVLPDEYKTGPIANETVSRKRIMSVPTAFTVQTNVITYESSISQIQFNLLNIGGDITRIVTNYTIKNRLVSIFLGFEGLSEADFQPIYTGQINNVVKSPDSTYYTFTVVDPLKQLKQAILKGHTQLVTNYNPTDEAQDNAGNTVTHTPDTTMQVSSVVNFSTATDLNDGKGARSFLKSGDYLFSYTGVSSGSIVDGSCVWTFLSYGSGTAWLPNTAYTVGQQRSNLGAIYSCTTAGTSGPSGGPFGTGNGGQLFLGVKQVQIGALGAPGAQLQQSGGDVENFVLFEGNPVDLMLQIILSTGAGTNGTYDVLPNSQGIGIDETFVNVTNFERLRDTYLGGMVFSGYFSEQTEALKFIQQFILRQVHASIFTNKSGQLDMSVSYAPLGTIDASTIDDTNMVGLPQFDANLPTGKNFFNEIQVEYDYQPIADFFATVEKTFDSISIGKFQEVSTLKVEGKMIKTYFGGLNIVNRMSQIYLKRFSMPPPIIHVKGFFFFNLLNTGDLIYINSSYVPNYLTGLDGGNIPILCEVINASPDFISGNVNITLLGIGFNTTRRYGRISPTSIYGGGSFPNFTSATTAQKIYGFVGTNIGTNAVMSDNTDGYYVSP